MAEIIQSSSLGTELTAFVSSMHEDHLALSSKDKNNELYYLGLKKLTTLGMNIPPNLQLMEMFVNWTRVTVDWIEMRQDVKALLMPGDDVTSPRLMELADANNFESELSLFNRDKLIYGRSFLSVGTNEEDPENPYIRVESPREMALKVDARTRRSLGAMRLYGDDPMFPTYATLYLPDETMWLSRESGVWRIEERDQHGLGRVPVIMSLNRRRTGNWNGESEMTDVIPLVDGTARSMTNLQHAQEVAAIPRRAVSGASQGDFVDASGKPLPVWESYMGAVWALANEDAKIQEFSAASLDNFHQTVNLYAQQASAVTGIPIKQFGQFTSNPAAEGAIRADESQGVKRVERQNSDSGVAIGWALALAERIRTGEWMPGNRVRVEWHDPGTPTFSQKADALQKLAGGTAIISREGAWDELGWSQARKDRERAYFEEQESDPYLTALGQKGETGDVSNPDDRVPAEAESGEQGARP